VIAKPGAYRNDPISPGIGRKVAELAARQHGVVARAQLAALGVDRFAIRRRVAAGYLHELHPSVYAVGHPVLSWRGSQLAVVLACGPDAALSHRAAGDLQGLRRSSRIEVTLPMGRFAPPDLMVHRSRMMDRVDFTEIDGIPVTSVARTLLDLAAVLSVRDLGYALERAERLQVFDLQAAEDVLSRARGRRGAKALRNAIAGWRPADVRSELEALFQDLVRDGRLTTPDFNVLVDGERYTHEVDAFWPSHQLIVQLDGFSYHRTRRDRERDATKDADLELAGYRVLRLTWDDVTVHRDRTLRRLRTRLTTRDVATPAPDRLV
jgi:very-short-patch-repair endonuclease